VDNDKEPIFNVPASALGLLALLIGIHVFRQFLPEDIDNWFVLALAFVPARYTGLAGELPGGDIAVWTSPLTHALLHGNFSHLLLNSAWLLAFGGAVAQRVGGWRFLLFSALTAIAGALTFLAFNWGLVAIMIGASGAVAGMMGAAMRFFFSALDTGGLRMLREAPASVPLAPLSAVFRDRRIVLVTVLFLMLNALALFGFGGPGSGEGGIAWEAHIGGYFMGLLTFGLFDRPAEVRSGENLPGP
jgi:membrane associated rhomboid family serine protease